MTELQRALAVVKAAGYRVSKPKAKRIKDRVGPTFVARFADGTVTRMSTFTSLETLDWQRGASLSHNAYCVRRRQQERDLWRPWDGRVPPLVASHFEQDGAVLARCTDGVAEAA
jgi:hypothetical protein